MRLILRIGFLGIALVAAAVVLGGCGGGSSEATHELESLRFARCNVFGVGHQLRALAAGIAATKREFQASEPGPAWQQIVRSMEENAASINRQLPSLEQCTRNALREAEGRPVHKPSPSALPPAPTIVAHRLGPARIEPGDQVLPARPCSPYGKNGTTTVYIYPESAVCARVAPGERLRVANDTGIGSPVEAVSVRVRVGDYELWLAPGQEGLIPAPVETYLGRGTHSVGAIGGIGPTLLFLPKICAIRPPAEPGEELCFR